MLSSNGRSIFNNERVVYFLILFLSFYSSRISIDVGFTLKPYMIVTLLGGVYFWNDVLNRESTKLDKLLLIFVGAYILSSVFASDMLLSLRHSILLLINISVFWINTAIINIETENLNNIIVYSMYVVIIVSITLYLIGMFRLDFDYSVNRVVTAGLLTDRNIPRLIGLINIDPNITAFYLTLPFFFLLTHWNNKNIPIFLLLIVTILLTFSRGGLVGYLIGIILLMIVTFKNSNNKSILIKSIFAFIVIISILYILDFKIVSTLVNRFKTAISGGGSGRVELWGAAWSRFVENPFLGVGINNSRLLVIPILGFSKYIHNTFLELLVEMGFLLFVSLVILVFNVIKFTFRKLETASYLLYSYIAMLIQSIFLSLTVNEFWFLLFVLVAFEHKYLEEKPEELSLERMIELKENSDKNSNIKEILLLGLKNIYLGIKLLYLIIKRFVLSIFNLFNVQNNKIIVVSFYGSGYGDSPKSIVEELEKNKNLKIYWATEGEEKNNSLPNNVKNVKYGSVKFYYHMATAKIWIDNSRKIEYPYKRKNQKYIQTWHGGIALKKIEFDVKDKLSFFYLYHAKKDTKMIDLFISNSDFQTNIIRNSFKYHGVIIQEGTPRIDSLLKMKRNSDADKIKKELNLNKHCLTVLYAPTFRDEFDKSNFIENYDSIIGSFGEEINFLTRFHPNDRKNVEKNSSIIDVTDYNDLNELLVVSDILITDYSSVMFDFGLLNKPVFLLTKDLDKYKQERGFYFEFSELPFYVSYTELELIQLLSSYEQQKYLDRLNNFNKKLNINETGKAARGVANYIMKQIDAMEEI